jgi:hypothetical protein
MLPTPKKFFITAAHAEGHSKLTAFDNALLKARIGNVNLLRVSSILPPQAEYTPDLTIAPGSGPNCLWLYSKRRSWRNHCCCCCSGFFRRHLRGYYGVLRQMYC